MSADFGKTSTPAAASPRDRLDPTDAPAPVAAALRRQGLIGAGEQIELLDTPPPVRARKHRPGQTEVQLGGALTTVRTTPPPAMRVARPPEGADFTQTIADALRSRKASAPPAAPRVVADAAMDWAPAVAVVVIFGVFAGLLLAFGG
jgi:hypothetical protein